MDLAAFLGFATASLISPVGIIFGVPVIFIPGLKRKIGAVIICAVIAAIAFTMTSARVGAELGITGSGFFENLGAMIFAYAVVGMVSFALSKAIGKMRGERNV